MESVNQSRLVDDLRHNMGLRAGDRVAVHSSMKSLGPVEGGPMALIAALIEAIGGPERGTLLMPCFTKPLDEVDVLHTPCRLGLVPETFRTFPGVVLSNNRTHRVAVFGKEAVEIAGCHNRSTELGIGSPFHEFARRGGITLHIGCDLRSSSLVHVAEHMYPMPFSHAMIGYPGYEKPISLVLPDGTKRVCPPIELPGDSAGFVNLQKEMERLGLIHHGTVAAAECMRLHSLDILAIAVEMLARDPMALLCENSRCPVCPPKRKIVSDALANGADSPR